MFSSSSEDEEEVSRTRHFFLVLDLPDGSEGRNGGNGGFWPFEVNADMGVTRAVGGVTGTAAGRP